MQVIASAGPEFNRISVTTQAVDRAPRYRYDDGRTIMLTYTSARDLLVRQTRIALERQVVDPAHPAFGAFINENHAGGFPSADHVANMSGLAKACQVYLAPGSPMEDDPALLARVRDSIAFQRRWQRPSGLVDLVSVNYDSPPDTAFAVELACAVVSIARRKTTSAGARIIADELGEFVRTAAPAIIGRGFHTQNHRWVVCAALAWAMKLYPEIDARAYIDSTLAEGIDINADGEYSERSTGVYNAVSNRAIRVMADCLDMPHLLDHVRKNLDFMSHLFHADGSVVTSISTRQDRGQRMVPITSIDSFHDLARRDGNGTWAAIADRIFDQYTPDPASPHYADWLLQPFLEEPSYREDGLPRSVVPDNFAKVFAVSGVWRVKRGLLSATAASQHRSILSLHYGDVRLESVKISGSYLLTPNVRAARIEPIAGGVRLVHNGLDSGVPWYHLPTGKHVDYDAFRETRSERDKWTLPSMDQTIDILEVERGFDLRFRSLGGRERTTMEIELAFDAPGDWDTDDTAMQVSPNQSAILKRGHGVFRRGRHAIRVGPGEYAHRDWSMRESTPTNGVFRVLICFTTPFDRTLEIRCGTWAPVIGFRPASTIGPEQA